MSRHAALLSRTSQPSRPALPVLGDMTLSLARAHEICGPARRTLALDVAAACDGPVLWIAPAWLPERLNGEGVTSRIDPGRLLVLHLRRSEDLLWSMEEALRSGAVPLVVADLPGPPGLTPVRRLHLAAETGMAEGAVSPLGLLLTPGDGGAAGVESRWHIAPHHSASESRWTLERRRARAAPPGRWQIGQSSKGSEQRLRLTPPPATETPEPREPRATVRSPEP
ncbi:protein ImuA [Aliiruegeria haliotis]|uniref:Protein ImuA n=1 Tax=Aliiruegeria haliotis TaxID=1280846 RepID=A0A2T0RUP2_9RHOB|nr:hypothetical protein [Aliiruegeria haliotis]PRY24919.1 protein ImuA [Aliiruegeria haliotis]